MSYYRTCPHCGAHLDPDERCDCIESKRAWAAGLISQLTPEERVALWDEIKNIPVSVTSTDRDGVEQISRSISTPSVAETSGFVNSREREVGKKDHVSDPDTKDRRGSRRC